MINVCFRFILSMLCLFSVKNLPSLRKIDLKRLQEVGEEYEAAWVCVSCCRRIDQHWERNYILQHPCNTMQQFLVIRKKDSKVSYVQIS